MVRVKVCGLMSRADVDASSGADAVGFVVASPGSKRSLSLDDARRLAGTVPPFTVRVAVTTERRPDEVGMIAELVRPNYVQLHSGVEPVLMQEYLDHFPAGTGLIAVMAVSTETGTGESIALARRFAASGASALLLDTAGKGRPGGTGRTHDWTLTRAVRDAVAPFPVIVAGGLTPENVGACVRAVRPYAVDVSSGVEGGGGKSREKVARFLSAARHPLRL